MILSEEQAKTRWCPWARTVALVGSTVNRVPEDGRPDSDCMCIASECMAWRWSETAYTERRRSDTFVEGWEHIPPYSPDPRITEYWIEPEGKRVARRRGYCGMAGEVEYLPEDDDA
jgi:hypothetical protein